jgi:hypothetical protein
LKNYSTNCNIFEELNDSELFKSLIYLCNKNYRNFPKTTILSGKPNSKLEQEFIQNLNNNLVVLDENMSKNESTNFRPKRLGSRLPNYKKLRAKLNSYTKKTFRQVNCKNFNFNILKQLLELFSKYKEDDISTIHEKLKETFSELELDKDDLRSIRLYMKLYFQLTNMNERKLCINDEKMWKIINDYFKLNNYVSPLKPKNRKKITETNNEVTESIETTQLKKKKNKANDGEISDKGETTTQKIKEKEVKNVPTSRNIFMVFKDVIINEDAKSEESNISKKEEVKKRKRKTKKEIKEESNNIEKIKESNNVTNDQEENNKDNNNKAPVEGENVKVPKQRKKRKPKNESKDNQIKIKEEIKDNIEEGDKKEEIKEEIKVPKPKKPRKKPAEKVDTKVEVKENDIVIDKVEKTLEFKEENDVKIENVPVENIQVKKKGRQKKVKQKEENPDIIAASLIKNETILQNGEENITNNCKKENEPEKVKKPRKQNKNTIGFNEDNSQNVVGQQQIFFNNSLIENFQLSNQFNNTSNTINNNINNNISINNNYNNPEIKNINIVYSGDLNNRLQLANLFSNNNLAFLNLDFIKNFANTINPLSTLNQTPNIESFFENNHENYNEQGNLTFKLASADENIQIDNQSIPYLNIPLIIPVNELLNNNSQNNKYNSLFYNGFYQKIIDYNKNIAMKLSNEDININQNTNGIIKIIIQPNKKESTLRKKVVI